MSELLAINFDRPVLLEPEFRGYRQRATRSSRGWGVAWFVGDRPFFYKEAYIPGRSHELDTLGQIHRPVQSQTLIGHVLYGKREDVAVHRTGPFLHALNHSSLVWVATGSLSGIPSPEHMKPEGDHPLELAFCWLLEQVRSRQIDLSDAEALAALFRELNSFGNVIAVMSDGDRLWVYTDRDGYKPVYVARLAGTFPPVTLMDEDWDVDIRRGDNAPANGYVVATNRLFEGDWESLAPGTLAVIENGNMLQS